VKAFLELPNMFNMPRMTRAVVVIGLLGLVFLVPVNTCATKLPFLWILLFTLASNFLQGSPLSQPTVLQW
jgi:hypothetical protein